MSQVRGILGEKIDACRQEILYETAKIEAALDEVNVYRFGEYVKRLGEGTQFILITHRRGTMEEADVLYGITMQEQGVSKLLELKAAEMVKKLGISE